MTNKNVENWRKRTGAPTDTFCLLPWVHLSTRPDGSMRVCCTANASSVGATNDKEYWKFVGEYEALGNTVAEIKEVEQRYVDS